MSVAAKKVFVPTIVKPAKTYSRIPPEPAYERAAIVKRIMRLCGAMPDADRHQKYLFRELNLNQLRDRLEALKKDTR